MNGGEAEGKTALRQTDGEGEQTAKRLQAPISAIVLASVGGLLLFMGSFFLLVAGLGVGGLMVPALAVMVAATIMMLSAWSIWRKTLVRHEVMRRNELDRLQCDYCGGMNAEGDLRCRSCGAPLR